MICPVCSAEMRQARKEGVIIDFCPSCRGVWLDHGELEKIVKRSQQYTDDYDDHHGHYEHYDHHDHDYHDHDDHKHGHRKKKQGLFSIFENIFD